MRRRKGVPLNRKIVLRKICEREAKRISKIRKEEKDCFV
jgi:hypothetical protein